MKDKIQEIAKVIKSGLENHINTEWIFIIADKIGEKTGIQVKGNINWVGIGGSSSGPRALFKIADNNSVQFFESPEDKKFIGKTKGKILYVVSKSGETYETLVLVREFCKRGINRAFIVTQKLESDLLKIAEKNGWEMIDFPEKLSGRFSTFFISYPVLKGFGYHTKVRMGIEEVRKKIYNQGSLHFKIAEFLLESEERKIVDMFLCFYSRKLYELGENISQLIAESLGKNGKGFSPIPVLGPQFQHSVAQLILGNPAGKSAIFILPKTGVKETLHEAYVTAKVFSEKIPTLTIEVGENLKDVSTLLFSFQIAIATFGEIIGINPFDQPEVRKIRELLRTK